MRPKDPEEAKKMIQAAFLAGMVAGSFEIQVSLEPIL